MRAVLDGAVPEGDSVYLVARKLDRALRGGVLVESDFRVPALATRDLVGRTVLEHVTHGKHLLTRVSDGVTLHSHLLMDGSWSVTGAGKRLPTRLQPYVRVVLGTDRSTAWGVKLHQLELVHTAEEHTVVGHLGPDPLREDFDPEEAVRRLAAEPDLPVVTALLDQTKLAGLGNVWVNEMCFLSGVSPWTAVGSVDLPGLVARSAKGLRHSVAVPGAYQVTTGVNRPGQERWIYGRSGKPCRRCGTKVRAAEERANEPGNRSTWWCPSCQPGPGPEARVIRVRR